MGQKIITLSVVATDVLYALFYRGALQSGDLPSKSGAAELRELGFAETRHTATQYQKENQFTFLTAEGQAFAVEHLVNTRFGVPAGGYIGSPVDTMKEDIRGCCPIEGYEWGWFIDKSGQAYIHKALIGDVIHAADHEDTRSVTNIYNISLGVRKDKPAQNTVTFTADQFEIHSGVDTNLEALIENALKNAAKSAAKDVAKKVADDQKAMDCLTSFIRKAIRNECQPGGAIWGISRRGI
ncbi:Fur-regulated protein [Citrobacter koseri]|uniref:Fur-regulated protein n=1 Tax=Citrobacter koseri TaxID=545 RepID=UPI000D7C340E|nr:Fur-regulated protein [Citrobacter koseri]PYZ79369.1 Fur-regulated protein [Citrobacter koseri]WOJ16081.1 Fur-regulated protein [Citrobacter koseri]WOJ21904.1 Fur-regulated protein [Citrobacter koseri]